VRYLAAFVLEYAWWIWLGVALYACVRGLRAGAAGRLADRLRALRPAAAVALLAAGALVAQLAYYTLWVGGDHFEFRVLQHWVPLLFATFPWVCERAGLRPRATLAALAALIALGWPLPWLHWWHTRELTRREETFVLHYRVAPELPAPVRWYGAAWDELQGWLIRHLVGMRHQEHKVLVQVRAAHLPSRQTGLEVPADDFPVLAAKVVGLVGWIFPRVAIIDFYGLNDAVVARTPVPAQHSEDRLMAHDRVPPPGYLECFRPDFFENESGEVSFVAREAPLSEAEIRGCEERFLAALKDASDPEREVGAR
jgi:arabinofuranosyltransferase